MNPESKSYVMIVYEEAVFVPNRTGDGAEERRNIKWKSLDLQFYKFNVDGAPFTRQNSYGMGAVIWNERGKVVLVMRYKGQGSLSGDEVEVCSLWKAIQWAYEGGFRNLIAERDCVGLVNKVNSSVLTYNIKFGGILCDCRVWLSQFHSSKVQYVKRKGNRIAYELTRRTAYVKRMSGCWGQ
ncbi:hypothetical protein SLA2020_343710 [Shorea laevis]